MKKLLFYVFLPLLVFFIFLQFFQSPKNTGQITGNHILMQDSMSTDLETLLVNACLDCHSNNTNYLWYHKIAPVSFMVNNHITEGKEELNLSDWGKLDALDKIGKLDEISEVVENESMPLKAYSVMHKKARMNQEQRAQIVNWSKSYSENILSELSK